MSLMIRFANAGRRGERKYKLVVIEKRERREGKPVEILGIFEKRAKTVIEKTFNTDRITYWKSQGAQLSTGAKRILESK